MAVVSIWLQAGGGGAGGFQFFAPLVIIIVIFYFLVFVPQQRRQKQTQQMLTNLKPGDRVVTTGGIRGTIVSIKEDCIHLRVPPQDIRLEIARNAVAGLMGEEGKKSA